MITLAFLLSLFTTSSWSNWPTNPAVMVLGIAQDAGYPQAGCMRSCCQAVWAGKRKAQEVASLALLDPATKRAWLIDATPDFPKQFHRLQTAGYKLEGILLTHAHIGHYTGLMHLGREVMGAHQVPVYAMPRMRTFLLENGPWSLLVQLGNIRLVPLEAHTPARLGPFHVTPLPVPHRDEFSETVGFFIKGPAGRALCYIPDIDKWERWDQPIEHWLERVDIALLDGTFFDGSELPGRNMNEIPHPFIVESMTRFDTLPLTSRQKIHFIHFNHTNPLLDPNSTAASEVKEHGFRLATQAQWWDL